MPVVTQGPPPWWAGSAGRGTPWRFADPDDPVCAGRGQIVRSARQRGREPQQPTVWIGDHLHVHPVPAALVGVVGPSFADPVALGERAVRQDDVRIVFTQDLQQARRAFGEETDDRAGAGVGGGLADPERGSGLRQSRVLAQVHRCHHRALGRTELAAPVLHG